MMSRTSCTILILTYKGVHHLGYLLPTVRKAIQSTSKEYKINVLIVDNGNDIPTQQYVINNFPDFQFEFSPVNDYLFSLNPFVKKIQDEFVFILNDDMKMAPDVLNNTLDIISSDKSLFAVTCNIKDWEGLTQTSGIRTIELRKGWFQLKEEFPVKRGIYYTLFAGGGAAVMRTEMFNKLKGFDVLFRPAYCEDGDLSLRAWSHNWPIVFNSEAILYHRISATIKDQLKSDKLEQLISSQKIIMCIRNIHYQNFLLKFIFCLPYRVIISSRINKNTRKGLLKSLKKLPFAIWKNLNESRNQLSFNEIQEMIGKSYHFSKFK